MTELRARLERIAEVHVRLIGGFLVLLLLVNGMVAVRESARTKTRPVAQPSDGSFIGDDAGAAGPDSTGASQPSDSRSGEAVAPISGGPGVRITNPRTIVDGVKRTLLPGVTDKEIYVIYYWNDKTTKSSFLNTDTGQEGNVDEGLAFRRLVEFVNKHPNGTHSIMGFTFNLHGRRIRPEVLTTGKYPDDLEEAAQIIIGKRPFAAVSSHGSMSAYVCPRIAEAGIHNPTTFDLQAGLFARTKGYCLPQGLSWESQVDLTVKYLARWLKTPYQDKTGPKPRKYGILWSQYPGLERSVPLFVKALRAAGVPICDKCVASIAPGTDLTTAGRQAPDVVHRFNAEGVNTVVMPDSAAPMSFTPAANSEGYTPDYYVWPCSGEDSLGMVRLYNAAQWERAQGLTCYDVNLNADLTNDGRARGTEWYAAYRDVDPDGEPPAPTALVYQALLPLLVGITHAGPNLSLETFRGGWTTFKPYRYDAQKGRTTHPRHIMVTIGAADGSQVGDAAEVEWDNTARSSPDAVAGTYLYGDHRYSRNDPL